VKNENNEIEKRIYSSPELLCVELDNNISLALESLPPTGPDEGYLKVINYFNNDPYKNLLD